MIKWNSVGILSILVSEIIRTSKLALERPNLFILTWTRTILNGFSFLRWLSSLMSSLEGRLQIGVYDSWEVLKVVSCAIVRKGVPGPLFKAPTPWLSFSPFLKSLFTLLSFLFHPLLRYFKQSPPTLTQPPTALIRPTNLSWFKQISKEQFYHFNSKEFKFLDR